MENTEKKEEPKSALYKALSNLLGEITKIKKDGKAHNGKFATMGAVLAVANPAMNKHGLSICHLVDRDDRGPFLRSLLCHESGEILECRIPLILQKNDMQGLGSAITYARRYAVQALLNLPIADKDDDGDSNAESQNKAPKTAQFTVSASKAKPVSLLAPTQIAKIYDKLKGNFELLNRIIKFNKPAKKIEDIPAYNFKGIMSFLDTSLGENNE